jgi:Protein of unknown function (DUF3987)
MDRQSSELPGAPAQDTSATPRPAVNPAGLRVVQTTDAREWPAPMASDAFIGIPGDFVRLVGPQTEADPAALLGNFLVFAGVLFGREAWALADGRRHFPIEFLLLAGQTGSGRKGTASARTQPVMESVEDGFAERVLGGLSSGEGLIKGLSPKEGEIRLDGEVRRHLALLPEFASLLSVMRREGNIMSSILREAWDGNRLRVMTRKEPLDVDNVNLSVVAHVTPEELLGSLTATDRANGFANRFLVLLARRSKLLPEGGESIDLQAIIEGLRNAVRAARGRGLIQRDDAAKTLWAREYERLTRPRDGLRGALCGRAEAHVLRLSLLYALLDSAPAIREEHLKAACAFWDYCERSVDYIFGGSTGDPDGDRILGALASGPMSMTDVLRLFGNNRSRDWIGAKMGLLAGAGKIVATTKKGERKEAVPAWALA